MSSGAVPYACGSEVEETEENRVSAMIPYLVMIPLSYLLGALPFGLILGKLFGGVDVREYGSGKTGMTNVMRTAGVPAAALSLVLDMGKSMLAVGLALIFFRETPGAHAAAAIAVLIGHNWSVFIGFRGGRGTAPGWGGLIVLSPWSGLVAGLVGVPCVAISRYVSLGSIMGTLSGVLTLAILIALGRAPVEYLAYVVVGAALVIGLHKDNIQRLISGTERKIGQSALPTD